MACVASANGIKSVEIAYRMMREGRDPADAIVSGVAVVENDPNDMSVGYGGLPNEDCVVQLDASVMHGPTHKSGAVACIENIKNPAQVALLVLKRTDHCLIVGEGAKRFALKWGFKDEDLLTEPARQAWLAWKTDMSKRDDWLDADEMDWDAKDPRNSGPLAPAGTGALDRMNNMHNPFEEHLRRVGADYHVEWRGGVPYTTGTINCSAVDAKENLASCTTTSGLSWKIPGRVGDSPIVGAGMYCDNDVGAAGATGRGEAAIVNCTAHSIIREMERGLTPGEACLETLKRVAAKTREKRLLSENGRVNFGLTLYAVRKDGAYGSASITPARFAVCDESGPRHENSLALYS